MLSSLSKPIKISVFMSIRVFFLRFLVAAITLGSSFAACRAQQETEPKLPERAVANEQIIYIPYDKLKDVFEREGRGVFLPYDQFQKLWQEARSARKNTDPDSPPVDVILVSAENTATIEKEIMVVRALINVELLRSGWLKIPLRLNDAAILTATVDKQPARIVHESANGYSLLFENKETKPARIQVELEYAKAYEKTPGQNSVSFMAPQAPVNKWLIRIPDSGVKVKVEPMLATTESPAQTGSATAKTVGTEVLAFIGISPNIRIGWVPKSEGGTGMTPLASVQIQHRVTIEEGMARTTSQFLYSIDRSELSQLSIALPPDQKVINVFDPNVRKWSIEAGTAEQNIAPKLVVELFEPARQSQSLAVELESALDSKAEDGRSILHFDCLDANRQHGLVAVRIGQGLRAEPTDRKGLMQLDPAELPQPLAKEAWAFAYRFTSVPYELKVKLTKVLPTIRVEQFVEAFIEPQALTIELTSIHKIENAGIFQLEFDIPPDFELLQVSGRGAANVEAASIDAYRFANDAKDRLIVSLNRRAIGQVGTLIQLRRKLSDPNLLTPTGSGSALSIPVPRSVGDFVQWIDGMISVYAPESLRINATEKLGVRDGVVAELRAKWPTTFQERFPSLSEVLILAHAIEPVTLSLEIERKKPFVTVRQMLDAMVEPGSVKFTATLFTKVQFSSLVSLRLDVPETLAREIRMTTPGVRQAIVNPPPADLDVGYIAWELIGDTPWLGERTVQLSWQQRLDGLEIGKRVKIEIPRLVPRNVDQAWGQVVLNRKDSIDLQLEDGNGLRPIDPRYDLMPGTSFQDASRAFEYQSDWAMQIAATRYALEQVKQTSIERAFIRAVVTRSNRIGVHATYRMRNASQRLSLKLPEGAVFDSQPLLINGQSASLERGSANQLFIPLAGYDPTQALLVELRYTTPGDQNQIDLPVFPDAPAVQTAYLAVFLPKERILLASNGPWTNEFDLQSSAWKSEPRCHLDSNALMNWVKDGVNSSRATDFQTDGVMYLYSALRPEDGSAGSLHLVALDERWWSAVVIIGLLCFGFFFLLSSVQNKVVAVAALTATVIALGAFASTLASQLLNTPAVIGGLLVLVLWGTREVVQKLNTGKRVQSTLNDTDKDTVEQPPEASAVQTSETDEVQGGSENV